MSVNNAYAEETQQLVGVNISGAELNEGKIPGRHGHEYIWPSADEITRFANAGFTVIRVPFTWSRMQLELNKPLNNNEVKYLDIVIEAAKKNNIKIVLDPHNYGSYQGNLIGSEAVPMASFGDFWKRLAERYKDSPNVIFNLMNEPFKQKSSEWASQAQVAIDAIRSTGAKQLILVPGTNWTGAHSWIGSGNAEALKTIKDPENNYAFDMHQYFDSDSSGTHSTCVSGDVGVVRLEKATKWLNENGQRAFLGEFGASADPVCLKALDNTLKYLKQNQNVWIGWTYWAAGKWWGNYMFNIQSLDAEKTPQFGIIKNYLVDK
ncbi:MAG: glycoside hydrolase family 5 protein [Methylophilus sp.]|uniref:glycoside hydrolase family 5 protein n=1 Tax=Methylophilus sp. TaxID=29541 RepID=UPI003FA03F4C